jgi:hypothetical protein
MAHELIRIEGLSDVMSEPCQILYATGPRCAHNIGLDLPALFQHTAISRSTS